jgi:plastocyanin
VSPRRRAGALGAAAGLALAAAGCGGGDDHGSGAGSAASSGASAAADGLTAKKADGAVHITMTGYRYSPQLVTVRAGQKIVWTNRGATTHDVKAIRGASFASKTLAKGDTFQTTVKEPGLVDYECTLHPGMLATIVVG